MKKVLLIAAAAVVATVGTVGLAGPAQAAQYIADGDECTRTEYSRIERGMSKDRVARISAPPVTWKHVSTRTRCVLMAARRSAPCRTR